MNINKLLNNTCFLEKRASEPDEFNSYSYYEPVSIPCRIDGSRKFYMSSEGTMCISEQTFITTVPVSEQDRINGVLVKSVSIMYDLNGQIHHYESSL